ncbi:MAG: PspC domain-containing protein [Saprospiraceae bacterium]|nr:PspC domain-containing protein [Bacteroidia bacterium]NNK90395.1 PspC domain-containing protein [Saprospiraceae bacterium]
MDSIRHIVEKSVFGVCSYIGKQIGIRSSRVRLYFIYLSFVTLGSPIILYLILAFWLNLKKYLRKGYHLLLD